MNNSIDYYINQLISHTNLFETNINAFNPNKSFDFSNETILITGGAGTIGEELFRQLMLCSCRKIILSDIAESALYNLSIEFQEQTNNIVEYRILDINDAEAIKHIFKTYKPTIVFHCAAYKHVPLMNVNPYAAVKTNILATRQLADISVELSVKKFIFISSDKAVEPISIMGMTKKIAEHYLAHLNSRSNTQFIITRFGNILGSNGSVLPVFLKQMELNIPLMITHKDMTRYFIGKQKACQLTLESTLFKNLKNNILVFNISKSVEIYNLAKNILSISEKENLGIQITNIRSGEKLHESMVSDDEFLTPTEHPEIFQVENKKKPAKYLTDFNDLYNITPFSSTQDAESILKKYL